MITSAQKLLMARAGVSAGGGSFPTIEATSIYTAASNLTSHPVTLPSGVQTGDLLLIAYSIDGSSSSISPISGWTVIDKGVMNGVSATFGYIYKIADGTEGTTINIPVPTAETLACACMRISGASGNIEDTVTNFSTLTTSHNAVAITTSWGAAATLWLVSYNFGTGGARISVLPTNYGMAAATENANSSNTYTETEVSSRQYFAATEDPGIATSTSATRCSMITFAIEPA